MGLPEKPKKPLTPYFRFLKQVRSQVVEKNPKATIPEVIRMVAKQWETVDEATKSKFEEEFKKEKITYIEKRAQYDSKLTDDQKTDIKHMKQELTESREKRAFKKVRT